VYMNKTIKCPEILNLTRNIPILLLFLHSNVKLFNDRRYSC
jgi:hypothetical protein